MDKRGFLKFVLASAVLKGIPDALAMPPVPFPPRLSEIEFNAKMDENPDGGVKDRLLKTRFFNRDFADDIFLDPRDQDPLHSCLNRLKRIQEIIGYGNFSLLDFDQARLISRNYPSIGRFSRSEIQFLEKIFYAKGSDYGFFGEKPIQEITGVIRKNEITKIARTGNYLYRGKAVHVYEAVKTQVGEEIVLTSGVRGVMKQFLLFLDKVSRSRGNLSMASRSLAPPGYSFHGTGDFDVGQKGFGVYNFTEKFIETKVYKRLIRLGYIRFRYSRGNDLGVRFEPWHIKVGG